MKTKEKRTKVKLKFQMDIITILGLLLVLIGFISWFWGLLIGTNISQSKTQGTQFGTSTFVPPIYIILIGIAIILWINWPIKDSFQKEENRKSWLMVSCFAFTK